MENIAEMKDCEKLQKFMQGIKNHIYCAPASSTTDLECDLQNGPPSWTVYRTSTHTRTPFSPSA